VACHEASSWFVFAPFLVACRRAVTATRRVTNVLTAARVE
jgi:hypothetical protein